MEHKTRRRLTVAIAVGVLLASAALANLASAMPVHVGVLGGIGFSKFRGLNSPLAEFRGIKTPCLGATLRLQLSPMITLQPEVLVVTDGISLGESEATDQAGNSLGTFEVLHAIDRLQVPVLLRVAPWTGVRFQPFAFGGPYGSVRLSEYDRMTGAIESKNTHEALESSDFGVTLGGGVQTPLGPGQFELQARYDAGLRDLGTSPYGNGTPRTGAVRVLAGWSF